MQKRKKARHVLFWIKSRRGTDKKAVFEIPNDWTKEDVKSALERWCSHFGAWTHGENVINYGWKSIKVPGKKDLEKKYGLVCKSKTKIIEKWKVLVAMFNIRKLS